MARTMCWHRMRAQMWEEWGRRRAAALGNLVLVVWGAEFLVQFLLSVSVCITPSGKVYTTDRTSAIKCRETFKPAIDG